jgi:hypothetical protein
MICLKDLAVIEDYFLPSALTLGRLESTPKISSGGSLIVTTQDIPSV